MTGSSKMLSISSDIVAESACLEDGRAVLVYADSTIPLRNAFSPFLLGESRVSDTYRAIHCDLTLSSGFDNYLFILIPTKSLTLV